MIRSETRGSRACLAYFGLCGLLLLQLKYETKLSKKNSGDLPVIGHSMNTEMFGRKHTPQISELYVELRTSLEFAAPAQI